MVSRRDCQWLKKEYPEYAMCGKTIYNYVFFHLKREQKKLAFGGFGYREKAREDTENDPDRQPAG
jgi:hypothetical protein